MPTVHVTTRDGTLHRIDSDDFAPRTATHAEIHNVYGMQNSRATYEGLLKLRATRDRPMQYSSQFKLPRDA